MSANGYLTASELTTVQGSMQLRKPTAIAWKQLVAAAKKQLKRSIAIAGPAGAYRSAAVQNAMAVAGRGHSAAAKEKWGLNPNSTVAIAYHPGGTHEDGSSVDIVGTPMDSAFFALAKRYGFTRPFGNADPNHFHHDGKTATKVTSPAAAKAKVTPAKKVVTYTVRDNDTLTKIAAKYSDPRDKKADLDVDDLLRMNPSITDPNVIHVGQKIRVA